MPSCLPGGPLGSTTFLVESGKSIIDLCEIRIINLPTNHTEVQRFHSGIPICVVISALIPGHAWALPAAVCLEDYTGVPNIIATFGKSRLIDYSTRSLAMGRNTGAIQELQRKLRGRALYLARLLKRSRKLLCQRSHTEHPRQLR